MSSHTKKDDFCFECHWEAFHLDGNDSGNPSDTRPQSQWNCPDDEHHDLLAPCVTEEACCDADDCDADDCSVICPSACDGFVDCDASSVCSVSHCDDTNCEDTSPVCFDEHCVGSTDDHNNDHSTEHNFESLLGLAAPMSLGTGDLLPSTTVDHGQVEQSLSRPGGPISSNLMDSSHTTHDFCTPYSTAVDHCHLHNNYHHSHHSHCYTFSKDPTNDNLINPSVPIQNGVNPADVFQMMGMCPGFSGNQNFHLHQNYGCQDHLNEDSANSFACFHLGHQELNDLMMKSPTNINGTVPVIGPCRSHHRCRPHTHVHSHPYSPYSRHSRSSTSSQLMSTPGETPPPLEGGEPSVFTTPEFSHVDGELHICKWTTNHNGVQTPCRAVFADASALQEHLVSSHMGTADGAKGSGYYCCWEGCHRPDEPFSQKSKLQGHFLTHSNYKNFKCSVCGKLFARQTTLERHERSHRGEKPYKCSECGKSFTDSSELKTHSRTHTGEKPFKCTYPGCNFQTGDSSNMSSHRLTHGERKHKCDFPGCSRSFTRPDQLKRHIKTTHKVDSSTFSSPMTDQFALSFGTV